jgi:hypothetical protein
MNKKTVTTVLVTAVIVLMLRDRLAGLPGVNMLPKI